MNTPTPSPAETRQTRQREPLRWLAVAALLLAFVLICCVAEVTMRLLQPRNAPSTLNLLSQDRADYAVWAKDLNIAAIPPELPAAQAAERATATSVAAAGTPTPALVGSVPTALVAVVPAPANYPTPTAEAGFVVDQPTTTPRPVGVIPTSPPPPSVAPTNLPETVPPVPTSTYTPAPTRTRETQATSQPTNTPRPATNTPANATNTPRPATNTPANATNTPRPATNTPEPPTSTPRPATSTPEPPTNTPEPPTNTPEPPTNTPRPTSTPRPDPTDTPRPTSTNTPQPTSTPTLTPAPAADVQIVKTGPDSPVTVGSDVTFNFTVLNNGPSAATNVVVTDTPAGVTWTFVSATLPTGMVCTPSATTISCTLGTLASATPLQFSIVLRATSVGNLTNTAVVSNDVADPVASNNTSTTLTAIEPAAAADVRITKARAGSGTINVNDDVSYTLTVTNNGPAPATNVNVVDTPSGVTWTFGSATPSQGSCTPPASAGAPFQCALGGLASGASATINVTIRPTTGGTLTNSAAVSAAETDPSTGNNQASVNLTVNVPVPAGLAISKGASASAARNNVDAVTYTITIANNTGGAVTITRITDDFDAFVVGSCSSSSGGSCSPPVTQPGQVVWTGSVTLQDGETMTLSIEGTFFVTGALPSNQCNPTYSVQYTTAAGPGSVTNAGEACVQVTP